MVRLLGRLVFVLGCTVAAAGCAPDFNPEPPKQSGDSFGKKFFTIACQRVAYTSSLHNAALNPNKPVDVSGSRYRQVCRYGPAYLPADAATHDPKVATLVDFHDQMVEAVDLIFPGSELSDLQDYMIAILPLTDNDSFPATVRKGAEIIGMMEQDQDLHWSLARLEGRAGYRPREVCLGIMREVLGYPKLHDTLNTLLALVGEGGKGHKAFLDLMEAVSLELRTVQMIHDPNRPDPEHPGAKNRTLRLALDLLLTKDQGFGTGTPLPMVRRDWRGLAMVLPDPATKQLPTPFVDQDADGLADVDPQLGHFVTAPKGSPIPQPFVWDKSKPDPAPLRDGQGRALNAAGNPIYDYVDLDTTLLAALSRDALEMMDPDKRIGTKLLVGVSALLGDRVDRQKQGEPGEMLTYRGFDTTKAPILDILYGVLQVLRDPNIDDTLDAAVQLMKKHEGETARLIGGLLDVKDLSKKAVYDSARMDPKSNYYDDLLAVLRQIVNKDGGKLMEDLLTALGTPAAKNMPIMLANYIKYRDVHVLAGNGKDIANPYFKDPVDRTKPDTDKNRSIQQRLGHIIHNTNGMKMCSKQGAEIALPLPAPFNFVLAGPFNECELFEVQNGALFYMQSMARLRDSSGNLTSTPKGYLRLKTENMPTLLAAAVKALGEDFILDLLAGIDGMSSHPTTEAINRLMFLDPLPGSLPDVQDPSIDIDGHQINKYHVGSLLSWEVPHPQFVTGCDPVKNPCQFFDAMRPVVQAFADHDAEQLFLDLLSVTHTHWSSKSSATYQFTDPNKPDYSSGGDIRSYEPLLIDVLTTTDFMDAFNAVSPVLDKLVLPNGKPAKKSLVQTIAYLIDPTRSPNLTYRDGRAKSYTTDGTKEIPGGVSPFYILADAWAAKRDAIKKMEAADKFVVGAWNTSTSDLVDLFLDVDGTLAQSKFKNRRIIPATDALVSFLKQRLAAHRSLGDLAFWLSTDLPDAIEQKLASPVMARAADFLRIAEDDKPTREAVCNLVAHLVDEINHNPSFRSSVTGIADLAQILLDDTDIVPVVRVMGKVIEPKRKLIETALRFLKPASAEDTKESLSKILRNAYQEQSPGKSPVQTLLDLATELHRLKPGSYTPYTGPDFQEAFRQAKDFLANQETGLEKFFEIVKSRCGGPCPTN